MKLCFWSKRQGQKKRTARHTISPGQILLRCPHRYVIHTYNNIYIQFWSKLQRLLRCLQGDHQKASTCRYVVSAPYCHSKPQAFRVETTTMHPTRLEIALVAPPRSWGSASAPWAGVTGCDRMDWKSLRDVIWVPDIFNCHLSMDHVEHLQH